SGSRQLARDDQALHLVRALANLAQARIAKVALHRKLARVAVAAVNLDGGVASAGGRLGGVELAHGRLAPVWPALILEPGRAPAPPCRRRGPRASRCACPCAAPACRARR